MTSLIILLIVIVVVILATARYRIHPFISLIMASIIVGIFEGLAGSELITAITYGFGNTLQSIGIIIAFGTIIGSYLEHSGGAKTIAENTLKYVGKKKSDFAMNITGFIVSIPVFCDSGFIVLSSLNKAISRKSGVPLAALSIALATGLYATHVFVPPTPGPLAAAAALEADLGLVLFLGLMVAIPVSITGYLFGKYGSKKMIINSISEDHLVKVENKKPNFFDSMLPIILPIILIGLKAFSQYPTKPLGSGSFADILTFIGDPIIALLIGVFLAFRLKKNYNSKQEKSDWLTDGLKSAGIIILITGAGGAFGNVLRTSNIGDIIGNIFINYDIGLLLPFIIAAVLKSAQGSSTVSIITTAAIISPMLNPLGLDSEIAKALTVLAIGSGAMTVSHINDSYFWVVTQFSGLTVSQSLKGFTLATLLQGFIGILVTLIISYIIK
ncbi:MAG: GntP family permease [Melioribacteraceae bacterium]|nr:GntP family permease [Melioribacteraceae bacterium]